jgi:paraquat-inducible protein A
MSSFAILVLMTVILVPATQLAAMLYMLVSLKLGQAPRHLAAAFRIVHHAQPWGMVEVFILGSLVSLVKITQVADVEAYGGIYCLGGYVLALAAALGAFEPHEVWERARALGSRLPAVQEARA